MPPEWRGTRLASTQDFPLLVKFIFPTDKLSIQVHPDDAYASVHEKAAGGRGKTEMWHAVSAEPGAKVLVGLQAGITKEQFVAALGNQTLEELFQPHEAHAGDTFFIPAGTPHTIGPGMILCEVQQYSDLTYRVYDYGRVDAKGKPRDLHIEKALEVMHFGPLRGGLTPALPLPSHDAFKFLLAACPYFATETWEFEWKLPARSRPAHFDLIVILSGSGLMAWEPGKAEYTAGECWMVPASLGEFFLDATRSTIVLRTCVPDLGTLRNELQREGIPESKWERAIFA